MPAYILHSDDCEDTAQFLSTSIPGSLPPSPDGYRWTEVPDPPQAWRVALVGGQYTPTPYVKSDAEATAEERPKKLDALAVQRVAKMSVLSATAGLINMDDGTRATISSYAQTAALANQAGLPFSITWRLLDNTYVELDASAMIRLSLEVTSHVSACHAYSFQLKDKIEAATTVAELEAIDINTGWPE